MNERSDETPEVSWQVHWGRLLRTARQVAGLSLTDLATATGLTKGYLSKLESGHATALNPSRATLASLALALPSFRPIAHSLGPVADEGAVAIQSDRRHVPTIPHLPPRPGAAATSDSASATPPIALGWPELEVVVALVTLERAAVVQQITATTLARAVGRERPAVEAILARLVAMAILRGRPPMRPGGAISFQSAPDFAARVGIERPGDALVLAAALLAELPAGVRRHSGRSSSPHTAKKADAST